MSKNLQALSRSIEERCPDAFLNSDIVQGELTVWVVLNNIPEIMSCLRDGVRCRFTTLVDITAVDYPNRSPRFELVYHLLSMHLNQRIRIKAHVNDDVFAPSITSFYPAANWFEREIFDMYGILFSNHPDLRRILTDYGFSGHPLRKDFPTTGYTELRYDDEAKRVVYEPVKLVQDYRQFDFMSPWEGVQEAMSSAQDKMNEIPDASQKDKMRSK